MLKRLLKLCCCTVLAFYSIQELNATHKQQMENKQLGQIEQSRIQDKDVIKYIESFLKEEILIDFFRYKNDITKDNITTYITKQLGDKINNETFIINSSIINNFVKYFNEIKEKLTKKNIAVKINLFFKDRRVDINILDKSVKFDLQNYLTKQILQKMKIPNHNALLKRCIQMLTAIQTDNFLKKFDEAKTYLHKLISDNADNKIRNDKIKELLTKVTTNADNEFENDKIEELLTKVTTTDNSIQKTEEKESRIKNIFYDVFNKIEQEKENENSQENSINLRRVFNNLLSEQELFRSNKYEYVQLFILKVELNRLVKNVNEGKKYFQDLKIIQTFQDSIPQYCTLEGNGHHTRDEEEIHEDYLRILPNIGNGKNFGYAIIEFSGKYNRTKKILISKDYGEDSNKNIKNSGRIEPVPYSEENVYIEPKTKISMFDKLYSAYKVIDGRSQLKDDEFMILCTLFKNEQKIKDSIKMNSIDEMKVKVFTFMDMCPACWTAWNTLYGELKTLYLGQDEQKKLTVEVYSIKPHCDTKHAFFHKEDDEKHNNEYAKYQESKNDKWCDLQYRNSMKWENIPSYLKNENNKQKFQDINNGDDISTKIEDNFVKIHQYLDRYGLVGAANKNINNNRIRK